MIERFFFSVPAEIRKTADESGRELMVIEGIASTPDEDSQNEILDPSGFDFDYFVSNGFMNWHHDVSTPRTAMIGEPVRAWVDEWNRFRIVAKLYPENPIARQAYEMIEVLEKNSDSRRMGFSVEGTVVERDASDPRRVTRCSITGCALTHIPANSMTLATVVKAMNAGTPDRNATECQLNLDGSRRYVYADGSVRMFPADWKGEPCAEEKHEKYHTAGKKKTLNASTLDGDGAQAAEFGLSDPNLVLSMLPERQQYIEVTKKSSPSLKNMTFTDSLKRRIGLMPALKKARVLKKSTEVLDLEELAQKLPGIEEELAELPVSSVVDAEMDGKLFSVRKLDDGKYEVSEKSGDGSGVRKDTERDGNPEEAVAPASGDSPDTKSMISLIETLGALFDADTMRAFESEVKSAAAKAIMAKGQKSAGSPQDSGSGVKAPAEADAIETILSMLERMGRNQEELAQKFEKLEKSAHQPPNARNHVPFLERRIGGPFSAENAEIEKAIAKEASALGINSSTVTSLVPMIHENRDIIVKGFQNVAERLENEAASLTGPARADRSDMARMVRNIVTECKFGHGVPRQSVPNELVVLFAQETGKILI